MGQKYSFLKKNMTVKKENIKQERSNILSSETPFSITEEYKALRANLTFSIPSDECKIIGITSADRMEGKSITCLNLAITFAETNARVLLMDCDLRLPKIGLLIDKVATPGISNLLVHLSSMDDVIQPVKKFGFDVILSGNIPPNPSELLGSDQMSKILGELSKRYDYIFIDTPPVNAVSDAVVLSKQLTGMMFVVRAGLSEKGSVKNAINQLDFAGVNILGFILNGASAKNLGRNKKYYMNC